MTLSVQAMVHQAHVADFQVVVEALKEDHQIHLAALVVVILSNFFYDTTHDFFR